MAISKNNYRCLIQIDFSIGFYFKEINSRISFIKVYIVVIFVIYFAIDPGILIFIEKHFRVVLII